MMRRMLLETIDKVADGGVAPGADPATHRNVRPHEGIIRSDQDWRQAFGSEIVAKW
jgi:hypothetical protein